MGRGFGVTAAVHHDVVGELARHAEQLGYTSLWVNDMPQADGLASLAAAAAATDRLRLGVGVIPLDRRPPDVIEAGVRAFELPVERLLLGIGGGGSQGAIARVRAGADSLGDIGAEVVVGALGPKMSALAGEVADGVLYNWMTADFVPGVGSATGEAAEHAGRPQPALMAYVRCGFLPHAEQRVRDELTRYDGLSYFAEHEQRMGVSAFDTCLLVDDVDALQAGVAAYESVLDETVVRAITPDDELDTILELMRACAPVA